MASSMAACELGKKKAKKNHKTKCRLINGCLLTNAKWSTHKHSKKEKNSKTGRHASIQHARRFI